MTNIIEIQNEIKEELGKKEVINALVATTFKGFQTPQIYMAIQEGMMRGFTFRDFLEKNIYAVPYGSGYSLITSIDYARKIGMRSGVVGTSAPEYTMKDDKIESCTRTVKRKVGEYVGDYTATVFFDEYSTKRNLWASKPRTMIAKVAEMHALRMACPEELAKTYIEDEMAKEEKPQINPIDYKEKLEVCMSIKELNTAWANLPVEAKTDETIISLAKEMKAKLKDIKKHEDNTV